MKLRLLLATVSLLSIAACGAEAANVKPVVLSPTTGKNQNIQTGDTLVGPDGTTPYATGSTAPGGSPGQVEYNNSGVFGGFTVSGDFTLNTGTGAATLATVNSNVGSFTNVNLTVNAKGLITAAANGSAGGCTTFICLSDTPGNYTSAGLKVVRVNTGATALEYVTAGPFFLGSSATDLSSGTVACARLPALTGDVTSSSCATTLANSGVSAGTYTKVTVNVKGLVTTGATATLASADFANQGTTTTVLHGNAAGNPSWGLINLATDVTSNLPVTNLNSGTGASGSTFWAGDGTWKAATTVGYVTGSGTTGFLAKWTSSSALGNADLTGPIFTAGTVATEAANPFEVGPAASTSRSLSYGFGQPGSSERMSSLYMRRDAPELWQQQIPAGTAPARVQEAVVLHSYTLTFSTTPVVGNYVIASCYLLSGLPTVGSGWTTFASHNQVSLDPYTLLVYRRVAVGDTATVTPCTGASFGSSGLTAIEVSGLSAIWANSLQAVSFSQVSGNGGASTTITGTTTSPNTIGIIIGDEGSTSNVFTYVPTFNSGWTNTAGAAQGFGGPSTADAIGSQAYVSNGSAVTATVAIGNGGAAVSTGLTAALILVQPPASVGSGWRKMSALVTINNHTAQITDDPISMDFSAPLTASSDANGKVTVSVSGASGTLGYFATGTDGSNLTGNIAAARISTNLAAAFDTSFCSTRGSILYRGASGWACLGPSTVGYSLTTNSTGADPTWSNVGGGGGGGVTQVNTDSPWITGGPINTTGTVTLSGQVKAATSAILMNSFGGL